MVEAFVSTKFFLSVASKMNYDDGIVFTENNIVAYLAELEEYIGSLITYMAFKRDDPNAATSAIPLAQLNEKKFGQRDLDVSLGKQLEKNSSNRFLCADRPQLYSSKATARGSRPRVGFVRRSPPRRGRKLFHRGQAQRVERD